MRRLAVRVEAAVVSQCRSCPFYKEMQDMGATIPWCGHRDYYIPGPTPRSDPSPPIPEDFCQLPVVTNE